MAPRKSDRELVRDFFNWQWPAAAHEKLTTGIAVAAAGLICFAAVVLEGHLAYGPGTGRSDFWLTGLLFSMLIIWVGVHFIKDHNRSTDVLNGPVGKLLPTVQQTRTRDLAKIWWRSFGRVGKNISELRSFDTIDPHPLGGAQVDIDTLMNGPFPLAEIMSRSICLLGPTPTEGRLQVGMSPDRPPTIEFNPISVSILYRSGNQLIVYRAAADLMTGDLLSESIQRIHTFEIVQVNVHTSYKRETSAALLKIFKNVSALNAKEVVLTETRVHIAMTGSKSIDLPIGTLSVQAKKGELDREDGAPDFRELNIARALDQYLETTKTVVTRQPTIVPAARA